MKLFLASRAVDPQSIIKLKKFLAENGKSLGKSKIGYIPTAGNGEGYGSWVRMHSFQSIKEQNWNYKIIQLEDCNFRDIKEDFKDLDIVWFSGGFCAYLLYWIRRAEIDKLLLNLFKKDVIYVGSSGSSMICAKTMHSADYCGGGEPGASLVPGLGYIDFEIWPHYEESQLDDIKKVWKFGPLCLLKDGEAITVVDDKITVLGEERILK